MSDNEVDVKFGGDVSDLASKGAEAKDIIKDVASSTENLVDGLKTIAEAVGLAFAGEKIISFTEQMADLGRQVERTAKMTGLSAPEVQDFRLEVELMGGSSETAAMSLLRMEKNIGQAAAGGKQAQAAFAAAGVSARDLASGNINTILGDMADKFEATADGANKVDIAMQAAGRGGASLIPLLDRGRQGLNDIQIVLDETGAKLSPELARKFAETASAVDILSLSQHGLAQTIFAQLQPGINSAIVGFTGMTQEMTNEIKQGGSLTSVLKAISDSLEIISSGIGLFTTGIRGMWDVAGGVLKAIADSWVGLAVTVDDAVHGRIKQAMADYDIYQMKALNDIKQGFADAEKEGENYISLLNRMQAAASGGTVGLGGGESSGGKPQIEVPDASGSGAESQLEAWKDQLTQKLIAEKSFFNDSRTEELIFWQSKIQMTDEGSKERLAIETQVYSLQKQLAQEDLANYLAVIREKQAEDKDNASEWMALEQQKLDILKKDYGEMSKQYQEALTEMNNYDKEHVLFGEKMWEGAFNVIGKNFNSMVTGIMQGTQTMGQLFQRLAQNIVISMAEAFLRATAANLAFVAASNAGWTQIANAIGKNNSIFLASESSKTAAAVSGDAIRTASAQAASTTTSKVDTASASKSIMKDAGEAAANVYASLSAIPYVGWILGPLGAAAAFAAVAAYDSFDVGTDFVPSDMLANIHKGEMIVPAAQASQIRGGSGAAPFTGGGGSGGGSDTHVHFHVSAMDSRDVKSFFNQHGGTIAKSLANHVRSGGRSALAGIK